MIAGGRAAAEEAGDLFVGREAELEALRAGLAAAIERQGGCCLVGGEPGIGKTRLLEELAKEATAGGVEVLWGHCWEGGGAPAFWPWMQMLRAHVRNHAPHVLAAQLAAEASEIVQLAPEILSSVVATPTGGHPSTPIFADWRTNEAEESRQRLFNAGVAFFRNAAELQPLVLLIEDLHAADEASQLLLRALVQRLVGARIFVAVTYREMEAAQLPAVRATIDALSVHGRRLTLEGLCQAEVRTLVREILTDSLHPESADDLVAAIHTATNGNPFLVDAVVRLLAAESDWPLAAADVRALRVPDQVRVIIRRRMEQLSAPTRELLSIAAVVGREFDVRVLERVIATDRERSGNSMVCVSDALREAVAADLLREGAETTGRYCFTHGLLCETLYVSLSFDRRVALHGDIGAAMETVYGVRPEAAELTEIELRDVPRARAAEAPPIAEIAHHFVRALPSGADVDKAIDYSQQAGRRALRLRAYEQAVMHFACALEAVDRSPDHLRADLRRAELLLLLGEAHNGGGAYDEARLVFERAAAIATSSAAGDIIASAALGWPRHWILGGQRDEPLVNLAAGALRLLGVEASPLRARLLAKLAVALHFSATIEQRTQLVNQSVDMARRLGDAPTLAYCLEARMEVVWGPDTLEQRRADAAEFIELAARLDNNLKARWARDLVGIFFFEGGDTALAKIAIEEFARISREVGSPFALFHLGARRALLELFEGQFGTAEGVIHQSWSMAHRLTPDAVMGLSCQLLLLRREQGRLQELVAAAENFAAQNSHMPVWRAVLALIYIEIGAEAEARRTFEIVALHGFADIPRDYVWLLSMAMLAETGATLADVDRAAMLYQLLRPYASRNVGASFYVYLGSVSRYLGLLAATLSRWEDANAHFEAALQHNTQMGTPPAVAHTQYDYAAALITHGMAHDRAKARSLLEQALATAIRLGMPRLQERATALGKQIGE